MKTLISPRKLMFASLVLAAWPALAQTTNTWNGSVDDKWATAGNWTPGLPATGDTLIFDGSTQTSPINDFTVDTLFGGISFAPTATPFTLNGNQIWLQGAVINEATNQLQTFALPLVLTNMVTVNTVSNDLNAVSGNDITFAANVSGPGALVKLGEGTLVLSNKTYTGGTTISNGLVVAGNDNGGYTMAGGTLLMDYGSFFSGPAIPFTADSSVGTTARGYDRYDYAGQIGSSGLKWTVIGSGRFQTIRNSVNGFLGSAIEVAAGATLSDDKPVTAWGGAAVPILVDDGATLGKYNGSDPSSPVPNPITLNGAGVGGFGALDANFQSFQSPPTNSAGAVFNNTITLATDSTVGVHFGNMVLSGSVTGPGALTKVGSQTLILSGTNDFGGALLVDAGVVQLGSPSALPSGATNGSVQLANTTTLDLNGNNASVNGFNDDSAGFATLDNSSATPVKFTFGNNNTSASFYGAVKNTGGGALSLIYVGNGTASFLGVNNYSGSNVVTTSGGTLDINIPTGTTSGGAVSVADGATLSLHYRVAGSSLKASGATFGALDATTLNIDLNNYGNPTPPVINATNGSGVLSANGTITIYFNNMANVVVGQFPIIKYTTRTGAGNFVLGSLPGGIVAQIVTNTPNKSIDLQVTSSPITTWKGSLTNNLWDTTTTNWTYSGAPVLYTDGSAVLLGDGALTNNVNLTAALSPSSTLVNSSNNYTFSGAGSLASGDLTKNGTGTLILDTANSYNNTVISAGTVQVGLNDTVGTLGSGTVNNGGTLVFNHSDNLNFSSVISGAGTVVQNNTNTLTLSVANSYAGGTIVGQGILKITDNNALGVSASSTLVTVSNGATLDINGRLLSNGIPQYVAISGDGAAPNKGALATSSGMGCTIGCGIVGVRYLRLFGDASIGDSTGDFQIGSDVNVSGPAYGSIDGQGFALTKIGNNTVILEATNASPLSRFTISGGGVIYGNGGNNVFGSACSIVISNNAWLDTWDNKSQVGITFANPITIAANGGQLRNTRGSYGGNQFDVYNGAITLNGQLTILNTYTKAAMTFNGPISGNGSILCSGGSKTVTINSASTYSGATVVSNTGVLFLSTAQQGGGAYASHDTATMDLPNQTGGLTIPMSALMLGTSSGTTLGLSRVTALSTTTPFITAGSLTLNGTNTVTLAPGLYATPGQYPLIKYTGGVSGSGSLVVGSAGVRGAASISNNVANNSIDLVIPGANPVFWTGSVNTNWDIATTANFKYLGSPTTYQQSGALGDAVTFDDSTTKTNVFLPTPLSPTAVLVNTTNTYTFSGTNITGASSLVKNGTGTLVLSNLNNNYTAGAFVGNGTLRMGFSPTAQFFSGFTGAATVAAGATLDMGSNNPSGLVINASGVGVGGAGAIQANYSGAAAAIGPSVINLTGNLTVGGNNRWDLRTGANQLNVVTAGSVLTKVGSGQFSLVGSTVSTNLGDVVILAGKVSVQNGATLGNTNNTVYIGASGGLDFNSATVPFMKNIVLTNGAGIGTSGGSAGQNILATAVNIPSGGTLNFNVGGGQFNIAVPINIPAGCTINNNGNFFNTINYSNVLSGSGAFNIQFQTFINLYGSNTFSGNITVPNCNSGSGGLGTRLKLIGNGSINSVPNITMQGVASGQAFAGYMDVSGRVDGALTLMPNQTLRGDFGSQVIGTVVAGPGSIIWPGGDFNTNFTPFIAPTNFPSMTASTLILSNGTVSLDVLNTTNDQVRVTGNLNLTNGGTIRACYTLTSGLTNGGRYHLISYGTKTGTIATIKLALNGPHFAGAHLDDTTTAGWVDLVIDNTNIIAPQNLTWAGDGGLNLWDPATSANWLTNAGSPSTVFFSGDNVSFSNPGTNPVVTLNSALAAGSVTVNSTANYTFTGVNGNIAGSASLTKSGTGSLVINTANSYTNGTLINSGTVSATTGNALGTGGVTNNGVLNLTAGIGAGGGNVTPSGLATALSGSGTVNVGLGTGSGSVLLNGNNSTFTGTLNVGTNGYTNTVSSAGAGKIQLNGVLAGSATVNVFPHATVYVSTAVTNPAALVLNGGDTGESLGQLRIEGNANWSGPVTVAGPITGAGDGHIGANSGQTGTVSGNIGGSAPLVTIAGGTVNLTGANTYSGGLTVNQGSTVLLNNQSGATGGYMLCTNNANTATLNMGSSSQTVPTTIAMSAASASQMGTLYPAGAANNAAQTLNVNGASGFPTTVTNAGSMVVGRNSTLTLGNFATWNQNGGLNIAAYGGFGATLNVGNGIGSSGALNYNAGSAIQLTESASHSSSSILNINGGVLTTTQPFNYNGSSTNAGAVGRVVIYNGGTLALAASIPQLTTGDASGQMQLGTNATISLGGNTSTLSIGLANVSGQVGSLNVVGGGTLTLAGTNSYTGTTLVSNSTVLVSSTGVLPTNSITVATNATLSGTGLVRGAATIQDGTLKPGTTGIGTLTISNSLTFNANSTFRALVSLAGGVTNNNAVVGLGTVNYAGILSITNVSGTPLTAGAQFKLFTAAGNTGNFSSIVDASGTTWSFTPATGIATVLTVPVTVNTNSTNIITTVIGNTLTLQWPTDHIGWLLQSNSVGLNSTGSWFNVTGSDTTNLINITLDPNKSNVFYRMKY